MNVKKIRLLTALLLLSWIGASAQITQQWLQQTLAAGGYGVHIVVDKAGYSYIAGTKESGGVSVSDYLVSKYSPNGTLVWSKTYSGVAGNYDAIEGIAIDDHANIYVNGFSAETGGIAYMTTIKYDSTGLMKWKKSSYICDSQVPMFGFEVALDPFGNVYALGKKLTTFGPAQQDLILIKYNCSTGDSLWGVVNTTGLGTVSPALSYEGMKVDQQGNVYIAESIVDTKPPASSSYSDKDLLVLKYSAGGILKWQVQYNWQNFYYNIGGGLTDHTGSDEFVTDTELDKAGNYYITGYNADSTGKTWALTMKFDSTGTKKWEKRYGMAGRKTYASGIVLNEIEEIFVACNSDSVYQGTAFISGIATLKYDPQGNEQWVRTIDTISTYPTNPGWGTDVAVDNCGYVYCSGNFSYYHTLTVKYDDAGTEQWRNYTEASGAGTQVIVDHSNVFVANIFFEPIGVANIQVIELQQDPCVPDSTETKTELNIPNVFTPNGDGTNDVFSITTTGYKNYILKIYNRWGNVVFESSPLSSRRGAGGEASWDGSLTPTLSKGEGRSAPDGTYYYTLQLTDHQDVLTKHEGFLTLIR